MIDIEKIYEKGFNPPSIKKLGIINFFVVCVVMIHIINNSHYVTISYIVFVGINFYFLIICLLEYAFRKGVHRTLEYINEK